MSARALMSASRNLRAVPRRTLATASAGGAGANSEFLAQREAIKHHAIETTNLWRRISYFVCIPAVIIGYAWVQKVEGAHHEHEEHLKAENGGHLPEKPHYDYLNKRAKPFPWGNNSLFFNPEVQKDMNAKEEE